MGNENRPCPPQGNSTRINPDARGEAGSSNSHHGSPVRSMRPESMGRNCILIGDLDGPNAKKRLGVIDACIGFASSAEFVEIHPTSLRHTQIWRGRQRAQIDARKTTDAAHVAMANVDWLLNNEQISMVSPSVRGFMRFGTTGSGAKQLRDEEAAPRNIAHTCVHPTRQASNFPATEPNSNNVCSLQPDVGPYEAVTLVAEAPRLSVYIYRLGYLVFRAGIKLCAGATRHHA